MGGVDLGDRDHALEGMGKRIDALRAQALELLPAVVHDAEPYATLLAEREPSMAADAGSVACLGTRATACAPEMG